MRRLLHAVNGKADSLNAGGGCIYESFYACFVAGNVTRDEADSGSKTQAAHSDDKNDDGDDHCQWTAASRELSGITVRLARGVRRI